MEKDFEILESKYSEFEKFLILFKGIIIGAVVSTVIQLFIIPLKYENNILRYGSKILFSNLLVENYLTGVFIIAILTLVGIFLLFRTRIFGIIPARTVSCKYSGSYKSIQDDLLRFLERECKYLDIEIKIPEEREITCFKKSLFGEQGIILRVIFRPDLDIVTFIYDPTLRTSMRLIKRIYNYFKES